MKKITLIFSSLLLSIVGLNQGFASSNAGTQNIMEVSTENDSNIVNSETSTIALTEEFVQSEFSHFYDINTQTLSLSSLNSPFSDLMVYNVLGQEVLNQKLSGKTETLDMSGLVNGLYIVKINFDADSKVIKVLKQ